MTRKHMGSSVDDFLKEEGIFEEKQAQAIKEVAGEAGAGYEEEKDFQIEDGRLAEDEPLASGPDT
jgi:hypothetical protein